MVCAPQLRDLGVDVGDAIAQYELVVTGRVQRGMRFGPDELTRPELETPGEGIRAALQYVRLEIQEQQQIASWDDDTQFAPGQTTPRMTIANLRAITEHLTAALRVVEQLQQFAGGGNLQAMINRAAALRVERAHAGGAS